MAEEPSVVPDGFPFAVTPARRLAFFLGLDAAITAGSIALATLLRFDGHIPAAHLATLPVWIGLGVVSTILLLYTSGVYRVSWGHVGLRDIARVAFAVAGVTALVEVLIQGAYLLQPGYPALPRSIPILSAPILFCALSAFRLSKRAYLIMRGKRMTTVGKRTLLVGAGDPGAQVLESIHESGAAYHVVGFVDDDQLAQRTSIHGVRVLGRVDALPSLARRLGVSAVIICPTTATGPFVQRVLHLTREAGVLDVRIVPPMNELVDGRVTINATREVRLEDLLGRETVHIDHEDVGALFDGKRVLVTGAAGTIGSEISRQIATYKAKRLVVLDVDESRLHDLGMDLRHSNPTLDVSEAFVDVRNMDEVEEMMHVEKPDIVLHAAAYKHVPMMEKYPLHALEANVLGTLNVATAAEDAGCQRFVLISTDKAVEPSSTMGASKRLAEIALFSRAGSTTHKQMTRCAVRFGNVIGSRGSVIPIFERQLKAGGPLTVTHPDIERFFMMTSEAVSLVLQAAALGTDGEIYILEMGKPVRILDVAREFIRLHDMKPGVDIEIVFTGLRPGEKLYERLHYPEERLSPTRHPRLMKTHSVIDRDAEAMIAQVRSIVGARDPPAAKAFLVQRFPTLDAAQTRTVQVESVATQEHGVQR